MENYRKFIQKRIKTIVEDYTTLSFEDKKEYVYKLIQILNELNDEEEGES